ncbi:MAG: hypothetical protein Q8Q00_10500 [Dehalococcoidia bacterium]|nr:hypothetical protein [Dehalococcoidia bacterium]
MASRRPPPFRYYVYVLGAIWAVIGIMLALWGLIADGPGPLVIVPVFVVVTIADVVAVRTQL